MDQGKIDRKEFFGLAGKACAGCAVALSAAFADSGEDQSPGARTPARAVKRLEFTDGWIRRFTQVLEQNLDPATHRKIMLANGALCLTEWLKSQGREIRPVRFADWAARHQDAAPGAPVRVEGKTIFFEYQGSAETGQASPEGVCLCPLVETCPPGLSPVYCQCSVGYVKRLHELTFGQPCEVELLESVQSGGKRCRFKITLL